MPGNGKKYYARFSCGHEDYVLFFSQRDLIAKLSEAEQHGLCRECKRKEFIKTAVKEEIPYRVYKELLQGKRNVVTGEYKDGRIIVYMSKKVHTKYLAEYNKVFYDIDNSETDENGNQLTTVFVTGYDTYRIKDELKKIGFQFNKTLKRWQKSFSILTTDEKNSDIHSMINALESLGCENTKR